MSTSAQGSGSLDVVIRNALLATASDTTPCEIGIRNGIVAVLGTDLPPGRSEIDACGRVVTPGGVDGHCHIDQPMRPPVRLSDDFESGSRSAACGGTTTIIPFAAQRKGGSLREAVDDYHRRAAGRSCVDYGFHLIISDPTPHVLQEELPQQIAQGLSSFKLYMTYDDLKLSDHQILKLLAVAKDHGGTALVHAENTDCIAWITENLVTAGKIAPRYHSLSRPLLVEREGTHRAIALSELVDVPILIVHVSGHEAVEQIRWARGKGLNIFAETCPQYLLLTAEDLGIDDSYTGARCVCSPPPRDRNSQEAIWHGLADGTFTVFSSDHSPFNLAGSDGKHPNGEEVAFPHIPNGVPGIETRLPLLYSEGVLGGRITLNKFVELTATNPAKLYGVHQRKGTIAVGSDADLVVWGNEPLLLSNQMLHHSADYTPYEGMRLKAWPVCTMLRGEVIWDGVAFTGRAGAGQFLRRGSSTLLGAHRATR
jgi:dihydropyrimidinase